MTYTALVNELSNAINELTDLMEDGKKTTELPDPGFSDWQSVSMIAKSQLKSNTTRVAVVGTTKSGKSTFVNSIFGKDYLKRGAGVLTSMVTRVRNSSQDKATLFLKNWEEINTEIRQAIALIPSMNESLDKNEFDIRRRKYRKILKFAFDNIEHEQLLVKNTRNISIVLIASYLRGYNQIKQNIGTQNINMSLDKENFSLHRDFVANDDLAVYLKDVLLEIKGTSPGINVEVADCQGSDSPNPRHLLMIQDYLNVAHLIIYVVSSRIGIRQADIELLSLIKRMGVSNNIVFIVNSDLNEHESFEDLERITTDIQENLSIVCRSIQQVFTFSVLQNLIKQTDKLKCNRTCKTCSTKEKILEFSMQEYERFQIFFEKKINHEYGFLLIKNHIQKTVLLSKRIETWIKFHLNILTSDANTAKKIITNMAISRTELLDAKATTNGAIKGALEQVKKEFFLDIDRFFGNKNDGITGNITQFIHRWHFDFDSLNKVKTNNLTKILYRVFQEFKQELEKYLSETIVPDITRFIRKQESKLDNRTESLSATYLSMFRDTVEKYNIKIGEFNLHLENEYESISISKNSDLIINSIKPSPLIFDAIEYQGKIKTEAVLRFSFNKIVRMLANLLGLSTIKKLDPQSIAIIKTIEYAKKNITNSITYHLKNYRENIKYQHIAHITGNMAKNLEQQISDHLDINTMKLDELSNLIEMGKQKRSKILDSLTKMSERAEKTRKKIRKIATLANKPGNTTS